MKRPYRLNVIIQNYASKSLSARARESLQTLNLSLRALTEAQKDAKLEASKLEARVRTLKQQAEDAEAQLSSLTGEVEKLKKDKEELENSIESLTAEEKALRGHVEKHREEIELSRAVATLMLAKTPEDIKQFEDYLHRLCKWVQKDATPIGVETAKKLIIDRLMPSFRAFECSNCNTRFAVDTPKPIEDSSLYCPICHFSPWVRPDYSLSMKLRAKEHR